MTSLQLSPVGTQLQPYSTRAPELEKDFVQHRNGPVFVSREVEQAISDGSAVVALESTIITHGMVYPANLDTALQVESIVRKNGAVPATIGIIDGKVFVGLQRQQLEQLATLKARLKFARVPRAKRAGPEETEVDSGQVTSEIRDKSNCENLAMHDTWRRGLAPLVHFKLPLPRVPRAKRAGPEAAEV
ncbi:hypothetical protein TYRP_016691 [Tyrophagus putrescentiae]|nr:hypothetical protein TYRP_016691 [Tyrophagus putrescentiae]